MPPVTITLSALADHLRLEHDAVEVGTPTHTIVSDLLETATVEVIQYAPDAPESVCNMAVAQLCKYWL